MKQTELERIKRFRRAYPDEALTDTEVLEFLALKRAQHQAACREIERLIARSQASRG